MSNLQPASLNYSMGTGLPNSFDGLVLKAAPNSRWKHPPVNPSLKNRKLFVPMGTPIPLKNEEIY